MTLLKRFTLVISEGKVEHVFYPVFPPDRSATDVIEWLSRRAFLQLGSQVKASSEGLRKFGNCRGRHGTIVGR